MTVYVEYIILNNLSINYLICYLTSIAVKQSVSVKRLLFASICGAIFALAYPYISSKYEFAIKMVTSLIMVIILTEKVSVKEYLINLLVFYVISFVFAGATIVANEMLNVNATLLPFAVCAGIIIAIFSVRIIIYALYRKKDINQFQYKVEVEDGDVVKEYVGYYDSGNKLYDDDNNPVVVISKNLCEDLRLAVTGELAVTTVGGVQMMPMTKFSYIVYFDNMAHKLYCTNAIVSNLASSRGYDIILHKDMTKQK